MDRLYCFRTITASQMSAEQIVVDGWDASKAARNAINNVFRCNSTEGFIHGR